MRAPSHTPITEGSSEAATWSSFAVGLWLGPGRQRLYRLADHCLGSGNPRLRFLSCEKAPIGVGYALFLLSDDQLTRIFHSAKNTLCCAFTNCVCVCVHMMHSADHCAPSSSLSFRKAPILHDFTLMLA